MTFAIALAACQQAGPSQESLTDACQLKKCVCSDTEATVFSGRDDTDVLWRQSGAAYCPEGFALKLVESKK